MSLDNLNIDELRMLSNHLTALTVAGLRLEQDGLAPRFDLTPGQPMRIRLGAEMPAAFAPTRPSFLAPPRPIDDSGMMDAIVPHSTEANPPPPAPAPVDASLVVKALTEGEPISVGPSRSDESGTAPKDGETEAKAESGWGEAVMAAAHPPAARSRMNLKSPQWTEEEDTALVQMVVENMTKHGMARQPATMAAAASLPGRTEDAAVYRGKTRLRSRIDAALAQAAMTQAQTETPEVPKGSDLTVAVAEQAGDRDAAVGSGLPTEVKTDELPTAEVVAATFERPMPPDPDDLHGQDLDLWRHLERHRPKWPMTPGTDLDLIVGLGRGDKLPTVAADLGIDTEALKQRYRVLTNRILDARGNVTIEGGARLIKLLRRIAKTPAVAG